MRSLASLLAVPALLIAGCGDNLTPDGSGVESTFEVTGELPGPGPDADPRPLQGFIDGASLDCELMTLDYEAVIQYADDLSPALDIDCHVEFDDGAESFDCAGTHLFATEGVHNVRLTVTDRAFGGTFVDEGFFRVYAPLELTVSAEAPACGLSLSYDSVVSPSSPRFTLISPEANVVGGGARMGGAGSVEVTAEGTYTVTVLAEDERTVGPICSREVTATVDVVACHGHTPDCDH